MNTKDILTIRIESSLKKEINSAAQKSKVSENEFVKNVLKKYFISEDFYSVRNKLIPYAAQKGYLTDEDIYADKQL